MLIGTLPAPIGSPLAILIYVVLILLIASALASVLLQNLLYAMGAFVATMLLVALLYLTIAPPLLFAVQLLVFALVSALILIGLLRRCYTGEEDIPVGPFSHEWIVGGAVAAAGLALVAVVVAATSWPVKPCCSLGMGDVGSALTNQYVVALSMVVVLLASAALGAGFLLMKTPSPAHPTRGRETGRGRQSQPRGRA